MKQRLIILTTIFVAAVTFVVCSWSDQAPAGSKPATAFAQEDEGRQIASFASYANLRFGTPQITTRSMKEIRNGWHPGGFAMLVEVWQFQPSVHAASKVLGLLQERSGEKLDGVRKSWQKWLWSRKYAPHPEYALFKSALYASVDRRFAEYFEHTENARIRLDEILWGGVARDGIPPLKNPKMISVEEATYLADSNEVFGVVLNGDARCYPKRILAWHEMFKDTIGGESVCGVYCTLCGSLIVYQTHADGRHHELGTSGFLYRSNKLMYDHATKSLWSTLLGEPVVGPLVDRGIKLTRHHVVTSTWGAWKRRHPETTVLSVETGHSRNYNEGAAYWKYFSTQKLMFEVPQIDRRLKPKDEVLALRNETEQLAIAAEFLLRNRLFADKLGQQPIVILTDSSGANRVYESSGIKFESLDKDVVLDSKGRQWSVNADSLRLFDGTKTLSRLPAHRAFWFGWFAQFPETRLVR